MFTAHTHPSLQSSSYRFPPFSPKGPPKPIRVPDLPAPNGSWRASKQAGAVGVDGPFASLQLDQSAAISASIYSSLPLLRRQTAAYYNPAQAIHSEADLNDALLASLLEQQGLCDSGVPRARFSAAAARSLACQHLAYLSREQEPYSFSKSGRVDPHTLSSSARNFPPSSPSIEDQVASSSQAYAAHLSRDTRPEQALEQPLRSDRPWSAPGRAQDERNYATFAQQTSLASRVGPFPAFQPLHDDDSSASVSCSRQEARHRSRSASNPMAKTHLLATATAESLALASLQHVRAGNSFDSLYTGLHLNEPDALIPAGNSSTPSSGLQQAGLFTAPYGPSPRNKKVELYKTELCRQWEERGWCDYKERCQFAHGAQELRPVNRHPLYKTQPCKVYAETGHCQYGKRCTFRHDDESQVCPRTPSAEPAAKGQPLIARLGRADVSPINKGTDGRGKGEASSTKDRSALTSAAVRRTAKLSAR